jgi:hypothetical protein
VTDLTLLDLVANGTTDASTAATLAAIGHEQHTFLVAAVPRWAGKSTTSEAILDCRPAGSPRHDLSGDLSQIEQLARDEVGGYVVIAEFSPRGMGSYLWGEPAQAALRLTEAGYSVASSIHADSMDSAMTLVANEIGAGDALTAQFRYVVYIERLGEGTPGGENNFWRRVASVHEVEEVTAGSAKARLLHRWLPENDTFERVEDPSALTASHVTIDAWATAIADAVAQGRTSSDVVSDIIT